MKACTYRNFDANHSYLSDCFCLRRTLPTSPSPLGPTIEPGGAPAAVDDKRPCASEPTSTFPLPITPDPQTAMVSKA